MLKRFLLVLSSLCCSFEPGPRDVFASVIKVATPSNYIACQLALAASFCLFHGKMVRWVTSGQLPVVSRYFHLPCSGLNLILEVAAFSNFETEMATKRWGV